MLRRLTPPNRTSDSDAAICERLARLEAKNDDLAPRVWVQEALAPLNITLVRLEEAIASLTQDSKSLYSAHERFLQERAEQERALFEEKMAALRAENAAAAQRTFLNWFKDRAAPIAGAIATILALAAMIGGAVQWWIVEHVLKQAR